MGLSKKKRFFLKKKSKKADSKKTSFCQTVNSQYFFAKLSGMGPWVSRIDWCEGHWFGSTFMAVRLSDIRTKTGKKWLFGVFSHFWAYVRQPHDNQCPSHQSILLTQGPICEILVTIAQLLGVAEKLSFFESAILIFFFQIFFFFCFILIKISQNLWGTKDFSKFWWLPWFPAKS